jgi:hypothetical protein
MQNHPGASRAQADSDRSAETARASGDEGEAAGEGEIEHNAETVTHGMVAVNARLEKIRRVDLDRGGCC